MTDTQSLAIVLTPQELFDYEGAPYPARAVIERLVGEVARLQAERNEAIQVARMTCKEFDFDNTWPDNLHLADVIEKRIVNMFRD
jgi:hypothetical protein